jgi:L-ascorbate metabolism protein UlaG (beta-lactamase superfamily)
LALFPSFGSLPGAAQIAKFENLPYYRNGSFQNLTPTPQLAPGSSFGKIIKESLKKKPLLAPLDPLPAHWHFEPYHGTMPAITWFGHSSYLIQAEDINLFVDPVFSKRASFLQSIGPSAFSLQAPFSVEQLPPVDYILLTHDHYDHLDYGTILHLKSRVKHFFTPLGVGAHLQSWGVPKENITELAWWEQTTIANRFELVATPARHFSGRGLKRNQSLWASFVLRSPHFNIFLGGDSGYDAHFEEIAKQHGAFELAILECGQYNHNWPYIHMMPEETVQAALDLNAAALMPVHWGKFRLAMHPWNEPVQRVVKRANEVGLPLVVPGLGQRITVGTVPPLQEWWA